MLTEHSSVLCFLSLEEPVGLWVTERCPRLHRKPMVPASRGMQDIHYGAAEETGLALAGLVLTVKHSDVLPSIMWFVSVLQKESLKICHISLLFCGRLFVTYEPSLTIYHWAIVQSKELEAAKNPKSLHLKPSGITLNIKDSWIFWGPGLWDRQQQALRSPVAVVSSQFRRKP